jgi:hypothetical protein
MKRFLVPVLVAPVAALSIFVWPAAAQDPAAAAPAVVVASAPHSDVGAASRNSAILRAVGTPVVDDIGGNY